MRKLLFYFLVGGFFVLFTFASQQITGVRIAPQKSVYKEGERVKVFWNHSQIPPSGKVRITIRKEGREKALCILADFVDINRGSAGYSVVLPSTCKDAMGQRHNLTAFNRLWIRVQLKGRARQVHGDSSFFRIERIITASTVSKFSNINQKTKTMDFEQGVRMYNFRLQSEDKEKGIYRLSWDYQDTLRGTKPYLYLYRNGKHFCTIKKIEPEKGYTLLNFLSPTPLCIGVESRELPVDTAPSYSFMVDFTKYGRKEVFSRKMFLPLYPEIKITEFYVFYDRKIKKVKLSIAATNAGPAAAPPFRIEVSGKDYKGRTFNAVVPYVHGLPPGRTLAYDGPLSYPKDFNWMRFCMTATVRSNFQTNGYTHRFHHLKKYYTPPRVRGKM